VVFVADIGIGAKVVVCPVAGKWQKSIDIPRNELEGTISVTDRRKPTADVL
jgi:hypothetical protein